jgi:hypothetical protein
MSNLVVMNAAKAFEASEKFPDDFITLKVKTDKAGAKPKAATTKAGAKPATTKYVDVVYKTPEGKASSTVIFSVSDVPIFSIRDTNFDYANPNSQRPQLSMYVSKMGDMGKYLSKIQAKWSAMMQPVVDGGHLFKGKEIKNIMQMTVSENSAENPGAPLDDPIFRMKLSSKDKDGKLEVFPDTFPISALRGKPKTEYFDHRKCRIVNGEPVYEPAMVEENGKMVPVDFTNIHKFVTPGSILKRGRYTMSSVAGSQFGNALQIYCIMAIIEPGTPEQINDPLPLPPAGSISNNTSNDNSNNTSNANSNNNDNSNNTSNANSNNAPAGIKASDSDISAIIDGL